jgi:hypothetical protein
MTDKELLHLAAAALGLVPVRWTDDGKALLLKGIQAPWNPLACDADAFRLATDLGLNVYHVNNACYAQPSEDEGEENFVNYDEHQDKYQASRRVITLAAARAKGAA